MDEDIFLRIIPIDETVTRLDVEPFHGSRDLGGYHLLHHLLFNLLLLPFPPPVAGLAGAPGQS